LTECICTDWFLATRIVVSQMLSLPLANGFVTILLWVGIMWIYATVYSCAPRQHHILVGFGEKGKPLPLSLYIYVSAYQLSIGFPGPFFFSQIWASVNSSSILYSLRLRFCLLIRF